ncbi:hypothetical protein [Pedobacter hartonius]|uniref:Uncharacterized protein n=1 Tax=Pedobacter hartonius TaxID=425514 RepID=A0A1H4G4Z7_9SPHI|nr:hypothetical protein [Pedobacter hartonius]SEB04669.1 hypothetical protein SAMN05443550_10941 [Pedobacter hartonius]
MIHVFANLCKYATAVISLLFGIVYLSKPSFLGYHKQAVQRNWEELDQQVQTLILAPMRALSGAALTYGFLVIVLQYQFSSSVQNWIPVTILVSGGIIPSAPLYAMFLVKIKTAGKPPVTVVLFTVLLLVIGYLLNTYAGEAHIGGAE